ncbi:(Fe-S)-binding protein [Nocardioides panacisoli]|uniref:(Fe-S)-binding protein n=1 Tax=Nocardioides panacisoli TaxID=627624 RepID=A0ABP7IYM1_9ACTN
MTLTLILGLLLNAAILPFAAKRVWFLYRLISNGQPAPDRVENVTKRAAGAIGTQLREVLGQRRLLKWTIPGVAHSFVMYAFLILASVYVEAYGALISRNPDWHFLILGTWGPLGFLQDLIAVLCLVGLVIFYFIRVRNEPKKLGRESRFSGSHLGGAYLVLFMIFNVIWTMFLFRGAVEAHSPAGVGYGKAAFVSYLLGQVLPDSNLLIGIGLLLHIGVMLVFLLDVLHSKHLHIFVAPLNVMFKRPDALAREDGRTVALGAVKPMMNDGKPVTLDDVDDLDEDATLGVGTITDFSWKANLDFASCTECGRCQSQCPAWNTEKPLSPKMLIMNLRDNAFMSAPYHLASEDKRGSLPESVVHEAERILVGETEGDPTEPSGGAVIDPDVLWSCTNCGACVNQCPVDIEHIDHITDMRRYQVLVESNFPSELNGLFRGLENKGNPWNMSSTARMDWAKDLPFDVQVVGEDIESLDSVDWLFWVGCAGAYEDRAKKTTRAVAELLDMAGVSFGVLGNGETCTGDSARRAGNEFVYQGLAQQNIEVLTEAKAKKVVSTCPHCMNTLKNEYRDLGIELEVIHHTQLLNRLVREGKLTPMKEGDGAHQRSITYHDPCFLGRHNQVYAPPRELLQIMPGAQVVEMERSGERSFCCGAGGARMWMEETLGSRINVNRTNEAVGTGADQIAVGCPFCRVMLSDGLLEAQAEGTAREEVEVLDVAQMLLASVKGEVATRARAGEKVAVATKAEPSAGDVTVTEDTVTETADAGPAAKASGGSSLFDAAAEDEPDEQPASTGGSLFDAAPAEEEKPEPKAEPKSEPKSEEPAAGGSLFDAVSDEPEPAAEAEPEADPEPEPEAKQSEPAPKPTEEAVADAQAKGGVEGAAPESASISESGSLFDLASDEPDAPTAKAEPAPEPEPVAETEPVEDEARAEEAAATEEPAAEEEPAQSSGETNEPRTDVKINESDSLFDL